MESKFGWTDTDLSISLKDVLVHKSNQQQQQTIFSNQPIQSPTPQLQEISITRNEEINSNVGLGFQGRLREATRRRGGEKIKFLNHTEPTSEMKRGRRWGTWDALAMLLNGVFGLAAAAGAAGCGGCCCCDRRPEGRGGQQQEGHDGEPPLSWSHPGRPLRPRPPAAKRELGRIGFRNSINRSRLGKLSKRRDFVRDKWRGERERRMGPATN